MFVSLDKDAALPLTRQIYARIREDILRGGLRGGDRLPSTRELAKELGVSRNTVMIAYELLLAEGYLETRRGSGTRVARGIMPGSAAKGRERINDRAIGHGEASHDTVDFRSGIPAVDAFPLRTWGRYLREICLSTPPSIMAYAPPEGLWELRSALADYLARVRGLRCDPENVIVVSGATQGLALIARLLRERSRCAAVEDPLNAGMKKIIAGAGLTLHPIPVDQRGLRTDLLSTVPEAGLIYVTPSHQFPLGGILPAPRRSALLAHAAAHDAYVIEDDYDSEFRHEGPPLSALQSLAPDRVVYIGSLSKILAPALRLGYMVVPARLAGRLRILKMLADVHTPVLEQLALARFIRDGRLDRHVAGMKRLYAAKRRALLDALEEHFPGEYTVEGAAAGLHLVVSFPGRKFDERFAAGSLAEGVKVYPVERYAIRRGSHGHRLVLGYGHLSPERIEEGIGRLKRVLAQDLLSISFTQERLYRP